MHVSYGRLHADTWWYYGAVAYRFQFKLAWSVETDQLADAEGVFGNSDLSGFFSEISALLSEKNPLGSLSNGRTVFVRFKLLIMEWNANRSAVESAAVTLHILLLTTDKILIDS
jgi:hypothetical protein